MALLNMDNLLLLKKANKQLILGQVDGIDWVFLEWLFPGTSKGQSELDGFKCIACSVKKNKILFELPSIVQLGTRKHYLWEKCLHKQLSWLRGVMTKCWILVV